MTRGRRAVVLVLDSVGVGALPDAASYGDLGSNTLGNTARAVGGLSLSTLGALGLGNITEVLGVPPVAAPDASWGRCAERSAGKDTTVGHWELMGLVLERPFPTYPKGFPDDLIGEVCEAVGIAGVLGNRAASGTVIIDELGDEHLRTGLPIVYTSADSVFQVAAHEELFGLDRLYAVCERARAMLTGERGVARVIARPFIGPDAGGRYRRTANRRDYSLEPPGETALDALMGAGVPVVGIGKIEDIFAGRGLTASVHTTGNAEGMRRLVEVVSDLERGFVFCNLVDFDMLWGHRNDPTGYARALEEVDQWLPQLLGVLADGDLLVITADHGCDPTTASTDHSREYVPLLALLKGRCPGRPLGTRSTFADVGATVRDFFGLPPADVGESFLADLDAVDGLR